MNDIRARLPRKLAKTVSGGILAEEGRLNPLGVVGITLNMLPIHRVTMTLSEQDLPLSMHDLVEVYNHKGSVGIYRVTKITNTYRKTRKIELSHGLDVFSDSTFSVIEEYSGTVDDYLEKIIEAQTQKIGSAKYWRLGRCDDTNIWNKSIKYDNLMECLTELSGAEEDYMFTFDMSSFPWTLNFIRRDDTVLSEFRLGRNTEECSAAMDDAEMCTKLYLSVTTETEDEKGSGTYIDEGYYTYDDEQAQAEYGIICKTAGVSRKDFASEDELEAWVDAYFERHSTPGVQITIDGIELNALTGESIDEAHLGRVCRVALPDYATVFSERIVSVNYPDALRDPLHIQINLANKKQTSEDAFSEIKSKASKAGGAAGGAKKDAHNEATYFRRVIGDTANGLFSRIEETASYIRSEVADTANGLTSRITETASSIRSEVADTTASLRSSIQQQAGRIDLVVSGSGSSASIKVQAITDAINQSSVTISADRINLEGYVTATELGVTDAKIENLKAGITQATILWANTLKGGTLQVGATPYGASSLTIDGTYVGAMLTSSGTPVMISHGYFTGCTKSTSGNTVTLTFTKGVGDPVEVSFDRGGQASGVSLSAASNIRETQEGSGVWQADTTVSLNGTTATKTLDVTNAVERGWDLGYAAGWAAAKAKCSMSYSKYYDEVYYYGPPATVDGSAVLMDHLSIRAGVQLTTSLFAGTVIIDATASAKLTSTHAGVSSTVVDTVTSHKEVEP